MNSIPLKEAIEKELFPLEGEYYKIRFQNGGKVVTANMKIDRDVDVVYVGEFPHWGDTIDISKLILNTQTGIIQYDSSKLTDEFHCYECHTNWPDDKALSTHLCNLQWIKQIREDQEFHNSEGITVNQLYAVLLMAIENGEGDGPVQVCGIEIDGVLEPIKIRLAGISAGTPGVQLMDLKKPTPIHYLWECDCDGGCDRKIWIEDGKLLTKDLVNDKPEELTHMEQRAGSFWLNGKYSVYVKHEKIVTAIIQTFYEVKK